MTWNVKNKKNLPRAVIFGFQITHPISKETIPLSALVNFEYTRGYAVINRISNEHKVSIFADVDGSQNTANFVIAALQKNWLKNFTKRYPQLTYNIKEEVNNSSISYDSMKRAFLIEILGIFFVLFTLIGGVLGHFIVGISFSMPSLTDSILLTGTVMLTSVTTVAGMALLLFEMSLQAQILIPLATSVIFGITTSALFVLPCVYSILEDFGLVKPHTNLANMHSNSTTLAFAS